MRNNLSGAPLYTLSKLYVVTVPVGFAPSPNLRQLVCYFICGPRRLVVHRHRMICLVLLNVAEVEKMKFRKV